MKNTLQNVLAFFAVRILKLYAPTIVGITGSLGKTSTKSVMYHILEKHCTVRKSAKNYNNEIGVPLTIIGAMIPKHPLLWVRVFAYAFWLLLVKKKGYPNLLILEMGIDRPKDMDYLLTIVRPDIGVLTSIAEVHTEFFRRYESLVKEKHKLPLMVPEQGMVILNADYEEVIKVKEKLKCRVKTYGFSEGVDVRAVEVKIVYDSEKNTILGTNFKLVYRKALVPMFLPGTIGRHNLYAVMAGAVLAFEFKLNGIQIADTLSTYEVPPGRMKIVNGEQSSIIIDDTYNAAPESMKIALSTIADIETKKRKIAVLGDMLELGDIYEQSHKDIGKLAARIVRVLVTVGEGGKLIAEAAIKSGGILKENVCSFETSDQAGEWLREHLREGDIILIKGSQAIRMEKCVKQIMKEKEKSHTLLVRQETQWLKR